MFYQSPDLTFYPAATLSGSVTVTVTVCRWLAVMDKIIQICSTLLERSHDGDFLNYILSFTMLQRSLGRHKVYFHLFCLMMEYMKLKMPDYNIIYKELIPGDWGKECFINSFC